MKSFARIAVLSAFLAPVIAWAEEPKPAEKTAKSADEFTKAYVVGVVTGEVTKISATSVTLKVPEVVQTGTTRSRAGGHSISVPKLSVKYVEATYAIADTVKVKTVSGKESPFADIKTGEQIAVHVDEVQFGKLGEKLSKRIEVRKIDVPNPTPKTDKADKAEPVAETKKK